MTDSPEYNVKRARLSEWLTSRRAGAVLLASAPNLHWLALGGDVARPGRRSSAFVVTTDACFLLCPAEDADQLRQEEIRGLQIEIVPVARLDTVEVVARARALVPDGAQWRSDTPGLGLEHDETIHELRRTLTSDEVTRLQRLARDAATVVDEVAAECFRGIQEREVAARLAAQCVRRNVTPVSILAGADDRLEQYTRPRPKNATVEQILMMSLVGTRGGLHVALSRTLCLANPTADFVQRFGDVMQDVVRLVHASRPGTSLGETVRGVFSKSRDAYGSLGGLSGYAVPEVEAHAHSDCRLEASQVVTWSVCAPGIRGEETCLVTDTGTELVTVTDGWPHRRLEIDGRRYEFPDLLML